MMKFIPVIPVILSFVMVYFGAEYNGKKNYAEKVYNNCMSSGLSKVICGNYIKIIEENKVEEKIASDRYALRGVDRYE